MFKRLVNEAVIEVSISPVTPLLIRSDRSGLDPTRAESEFVRTFHNGNTVYIPGSSLKGAIRSHAERIIRTIGGKDRTRKPWSCDPLAGETPCRKTKGPEPEKYSSLCNACRIFGSAEFGSHLCVSDSYPGGDSPVVSEERNTISIDRVLGSAVGGPTTFEVVTAGTFDGKLRLVNFSLDHLGLLALVLRDFNRGQIALGAGKTRGLGQVNLRVKSVSLRYPGCELEDGIYCRAVQKTFDKKEILGAGALFRDFSEYGYPAGDTAPADVDAGADEAGLGVVQEFQGDSIDSLWRGCVGAWKRELKFLHFDSQRKPRREGKDDGPRKDGQPGGRGSEKRRDRRGHKQGGKPEGSPDVESSVSMEDTASEPAANNFAAMDDTQTVHTDAQPVPDTVESSSVESVAVESVAVESATVDTDNSASIMIGENAGSDIEKPSQEGSGEE